MEKMNSEKLHWLQKFIIDSTYFHCAQIVICFKLDWPKIQVPKAITCFNELKPPIYHDDDVMLRKLNYASLHMAYDHV
jgi:hypothetical protein